MARKSAPSNEASLRIIAAGIVVSEGDDVQLFSWQQVVDRLGQADSDLTLHIEWGSDFREDAFDWAEVLTFQDEVGAIRHEVQEGGKAVGTTECIVEFEADRMRLYYEGEDGSEAGITTVYFEGADVFNPLSAEFLPFGARKPIPAQAVWFSGSLAL
ncbi:MAG: hypothetical protein H6686_05445 [Fibrobacteria bacterium]|nr:hypothetical protein [Fibrobacteria bacterium]